MGNMVKQAKSELKQLPAMLGKLLGGIVAVAGFTLAVLSVTRKPGGEGTVLPYLGVGCAGIIIFVLSSRLLAKRCAETPADSPDSKDRTVNSMLAWGILLVLAALFLAGSYFLTR